MQTQQFNWRVYFCCYVIPYPRKKKQQAIVTNHKTEGSLTHNFSILCCDYSFLETLLSSPLSFSFGFWLSWSFSVFFRRMVFSEIEALACLLAWFFLGARSTRKLDSMLPSLAFEGGWKMRKSSNGGVDAEWSLTLMRVGEMMILWLEVCNEEQCMSSKELFRMWRELKNLLQNFIQIFLQSPQNVRTSNMKNF